MKKAQIKISWIVYPPNYKPGDGYKKVNFLKKAWNLACSMGEGAEVYQLLEKTYRKGSRSSNFGDVIHVVESN